MGNQRGFSLFQCKPFHRLQHPELPEAFTQSLQRCIGQQHPHRLRAYRLQDELYDISLQPLAEERCLIQAYSLDWEQQQLQLEQQTVQTGMMDLLRQNLSHELRNPLGGIRGAAQMLSNELEDKELGELAHLIMREVDRINQLTQRFGQQQMEYQAVDIHQLLDEASSLLLSESESALKISKDYDPSIPMLQGDSTALRQVIINLLRNAYQAHANRLVLRTRIEHGMTLLQANTRTLVRMDIEDNGEGVPEDLRPLLFLPLVSGKREGSGLGLALSQQIMAAHGGLISYEPIETGSRFTLRLPLDTGIPD